MEERDCTNCSHYKTVYAPYLHKYIKSCEAWECKFERKNNEDISDNARNEDRAEQSKKGKEG